MEGPVVFEEFFYQAGGKFRPNRSGVVGLWYAGKLKVRKCSFVIGLSRSRAHGPGRVRLVSNKGEGREGGFRTTQLCFACLAGFARGSRNLWLGEKGEDIRHYFAPRYRNTPPLYVLHAKEVMGMEDKNFSFILG